jgi:hypothetical protein
VKPQQIKMDGDKGGKGLGKKTKRDHSKKIIISKPNKLLCGMKKNQFQREKAILISCFELSDYLESQEKPTIESCLTHLQEKKLDTCGINELVFGDILEVDDYRNVGKYFVGENGKLIQTTGEYGYFAPMHFYDAPLGYYSNFTCYMSYDLDRIENVDSNLLEMFKKKKDSKFLAIETCDPSEMIEMEDEIEETNYEEFKVEYDKSLENSRKNVKVILFGTLIQFFPKEILLEISEFVL